MKFVHNFNIIAANFLAIHVLTMTIIVQGDYLAAAILGGYFALAFGLYINHKFLKNQSDSKNVHSHRHQTGKGQRPEVHLKPDSGEIFSYRAGQFVFLRLYDPFVFTGRASVLAGSAAPQDR